VLTFAVLLVSLTVVGMHQLSFNHALIGVPRSAAEAAMGDGPHHGDQPRQLNSPIAHAAANAADQPADLPEHTLASIAQRVGHAGSTATPLLPGAGADLAWQGCPGCGGPTMGSMTCLLALTLLVLLVLHQLPRSRLIPMFLKTPQTVATVSSGCPRRALSLVELSLRRT